VLDGIKILFPNSCKQLIESVTVSINTCIIEPQTVRTSLTIALFVTFYCNIYKVAHARIVSRRLCV